MRITITCPDCNTQMIFFHGDIINNQRLTIAAASECPICAAHFTTTVIVEREKLTSVNIEEEKEGEA
jgi:transcriptional regulator NrdR family protein